MRETKTQKKERTKKERKKERKKKEGRKYWEGRAVKAKTRMFMKWNNNSIIALLLLDQLY